MHKTFKLLAALLLGSAAGLHAAATLTPSPTYCLTPGPAVSFSLASGCYATSNSVTLTATALWGGGPSTLLLVRIENGNGSVLPAAVSYAGQGLSFLRSDPTFSGGTLSAYYLVAPATGVNNLVVTYASAGCDWNLVAEDYSNIDPASPFGSITTSSGNAANFSTSITATRACSALSDFFALATNVTVINPSYSYYTDYQPASGCCDYVFGSWTGGSSTVSGLNTESYTLSAATQYTDQLIEIRGVDCSGSSPTPSPTAVATATATPLGATPPPATAMDRLEVFPNLLRAPGDSAQILLYSPGGGDLRVRIVRSSGRDLRNLWTGKLGPQGSRTLGWDGRDDAGQDAGSGVYYVIFIDGDGTKVMKKVLVVR